MLFAVGHDNFSLSDPKAALRLLKAVIDRVLAEVAKADQRIRQNADAEAGIYPVKDGLYIIGPQSDLWQPCLAAEKIK